MTSVAATPTQQASSVIAVYASHEAAEAAVKSLQRQEFDMTKLSIVGKDYHTEEHVVGYYTAGDRMKSWGKFGAFWGGIWGLLFGAAVFFIPGVGPIVIAGPFVAWIVAALEGALAVGGLSVVAAALVSAGIPKESAVKYETELAAGKFILIAHGTHEEIGRAKALLELTHHEGLDMHGARAAAS
jgi:hypothetical protein